MNTDNRYKFIRKAALALAVCMAIVTMPGCNENVADEAYYTFTGNTVASYCKTTDGYSVFTRLLEETGNYALLSTYGHYTCFLPSDEAFETYFKELNITYDDLTDEDKNEIIYNHVIKSISTDYTSDYFEEGSLVEPNMADQYIVISYGVLSEEEGGLVIYINKDTPILEKDIEVHNGVVHKVAKVLNPSEEFLLNILKETGKFNIFAEALEVTGLCDSIKGIYDESFVSAYPTGEIMQGYLFRYPTVKKYGYTVFAEPDEVMANNNINSLDDLYAYAQQYYGNEAADDYTDRNNALNKFVSYHILDRQMSTNSFLYDGACTAPNFMKDRTEYYETMLQYRLMEIKAGNKINNRKNGVYVGLMEAESNLAAINGFAHCLTDMLVYDEDVMTNDVLNKRMRFDFYNIPPELTNNNIRWQLIMEGYSGWVVPHDFCGDYLKFSEETQITMWASDGWTNFEADELKLNGWYDFTLRMLPVPPGSYEVRIGYRQESWRGIAQLFIDGEIQGIPKDLRIAGTDPQVGWTQDTETPQDAENDKAMRNRGYMKAPASIYSAQLSGSLRSSAACLRIIVGQFTSQEYGPHYLRGKNVYAPSQEFHGDYIEIIPTSLIDKEDIY